MTIYTVIFYPVAALIVAATALAITRRNPVHAVVYLVISFLGSAILFYHLGAPFLAALEIIIYAGAIMVLFLFVIMLVNLHRLREIRMFGVQWPMAVVVGLILIALIGFVVLNTPYGAVDASPESFVSVDGESVGNAQAVAWLLYREYLLPFEIVSVFLLVAMIGAVVLARKE